MDIELREIINQFNVTQEDAIKAFETAFQCSRHTSTDDFMLRCVPAIRARNYEAAGCRVRPHGVGMEVKFSGRSIDFDFGSKGEANLFDAWRLIGFAKKNSIRTRFQSPSDIQVALDFAVNAGELYSVGKDYYVVS